MLSISVPMAMLVTRSRMISTTTGTWNSRHQFIGLGKCGLDFAGIGDADGLAAEAFGDRDMVHAVAVQFRRIDVLERELDLIVHLEAALRLPDQPEIRVVDDDMDVGELELSADRQFLDQELEIIVAGQRHDAALGVSRPDAQCRRQRPAERAGLTGIDPAARLVNVEELGSRYLRQADDADIAGVRGRTPGSSPHRRAAA